jgi:sugar-specific transcriptional regulator TrmB
MYAGKLQQIGLTSNESTVYIDLMKVGKSTTAEISKRTQLHRSVVHDNLDRLLDKGLIAVIREGKKRIFYPNAPEMLIEMLENEQKNIETKIEIAKDLQEEIKNIYQVTKEKNDAFVLRGKKGVRLLYKEILKQKHSYNQFGAPKAAVNIMGETFWRNVDIKTREKKIKTNLIFNESLRERGKEITKNIKNIQVRYINHKSDPLTQTVIFLNKVAIIVWVDTPIVTVMESKSAYESYNSFFNILWKQAKI